MKPSLLLYVAFGGAVGAVARVAVMAGIGAWIGLGFPYGTLTVNVIGSFVLGVFIEISGLYFSPSPEISAMIVVGVLGAFTTFSAFSLDVVSLMQRGDLGAAFTYVLASVVLSVLALWLGMAGIRWVT